MYVTCVSLCITLYTPIGSTLGVMFFFFYIYYYSEYYMFSSDVAFRTSYYRVYYIPVQ